jgi:quinol monooxygenase YgiN
MPFFVVVAFQARPGRVDTLLSAIRSDLAASASRSPSRRFARVYQHHSDATRLFAIEEWQQQADFDRYTNSVAYADAVIECTSAPRADALERLQHYRHMPHAPAFLSCATVTAPADRASDVEDFICDRQRRDALTADGLVLRAVYRVAGSPGRLLVLHGWRNLEDLQVFAETFDRSVASALTPLGATLEQFTGLIAAEYSWLAS